MKNQPIGIFDSGVGGLTVFDAIARTHPSESLIYFGDTGRYPYGVRSKAVIVEFACQIAGFLEAQGCKFIVIACNTASALALAEVAAHVKLGVIGVIEPGAEAAVRSSRGRIGVIATEATVRSQAYAQAIHAIDANAQVVARACPLFVSLAEEGYAGRPATRLIAEEYLSPFATENIDTLVLGCTHYPLLRSAIQKAVGSSVRLIDSAPAAVRELQCVLEDRNELRSNKEGSGLEVFVSDFSKNFLEVGKQFLGRPLRKAQVVRFKGEVVEDGRWTL